MGLIVASRCQLYVEIDKNIFWLKTLARGEKLLLMSHLMLFIAFEEMK